MSEMKLSELVRYGAENSDDTWLIEQHNDIADRIEELEARLNAATHCACRFDEDDNPLEWCSVHGALRDENKRLEQCLQYVQNWINSASFMPEDEIDLAGLQLILDQAREVDDER